MSKTIRTAYVTTGDPADITSWSGTFYYVAKALAAQAISVDPVGPLTSRYELVAKGKEALHRVVLGHRHPRDRDPTLARSYARQVQSRLRPDHDLVFSVGTLGLSHLECAQPIVAWTDATFAAMLDFYPMYSNLSASAIRNGNRMEDEALRRCALVIYSSDWAARSAIEDYGVDAKRVEVVPLGSNMETELSNDEVEATIDARADPPCRLVFIGAEWERKGGSVAIDVARELNRLGISTELALVGARPTDSALPEYVQVLGFVDKSTSEGRDRLRRLLLNAHFFVLPARADCSPVVLCEAAAHAVPVLSTSVGGIPTIVRDGVNGKLFDRDAGASEYASFIRDLLETPGAYRALALSSLHEYRRRLNWGVAGKRVRQLLDGVVAGQSPGLG